MWHTKIVFVFANIIKFDMIISSYSKIDNLRNAKRKKADKETRHEILRQARLFYLRV